MIKKIVVHCFAQCRRVGDLYITDLYILQNTELTVLYTSGKYPNFVQLSSFLSPMVKWVELVYIFYMYVQVSPDTYLCISYSYVLRTSYALHLFFIITSLHDTEFLYIFRPKCFDTRCYTNVKLLLYKTIVINEV